jgi:hypothetical protein
VNPFQLDFSLSNLNLSNIHKLVIKRSQVSDHTDSLKEHVNKSTSTDNFIFLKLTEVHFEEIILHDFCTLLPKIQAQGTQSMSITFDGLEDEEEMQLTIMELPGLGTKAFPMIHALSVYNLRAFQLRTIIPISHIFPHVCKLIIWVNGKGDHFYDLLESKRHFAIDDKEQIHQLCDTFRPKNGLVPFSQVDNLQVSLDLKVEYEDIDGARKTVLKLLDERAEAGSSSLVLQEFDVYPVEPNKPDGWRQGWRLAFHAVANSEA